jgi:cytosine/adenosine deaminase-related metal-dependent hydrolase
MRRVVEGIPLDLEGLSILPGHINAHDHLDFALFPRLGNGPYPNATAWARDVYHPKRSPIVEHLRVPKCARLLWGGLRNLLAGVTTVSHHNPYEPAFDNNFPVRVVKHYGWAHSLAFDKKIRESFDATAPGAPFLIHAAEGTDTDSAQEILELDRLGVLSDRTVLIHAVALDDRAWQLIRERNVSVITCPRSNIFTLGRTADVPADIPLGLGTDSSLTSEGDFLDELQRFGAQRHDAAKILRLQGTSDYIAAPEFAHQPELVVIGDRIHLISQRLAPSLPSRLRAEFSPLQVETREPVLVRWNIPDLIAATGLAEIRLAGRRVMRD